MALPRGIYRSVAQLCWMVNHNFRICNFLLSVLTALFIYVDNWKLTIIMKSDNLKTTRWTWLLRNNVNWDVPATRQPKLCLLMVQERAINHDMPNQKQQQRKFSLRHSLSETGLTLATKEKWEVIWGSKIKFSKGWDISVEPIKRGTPRYAFHLFRLWPEFAYFVISECVLTKTANILSING